MSDKPPLPSWVVTGGTVLLGALLTFHVVFDALNTQYSNPTLSLAFLGAFGIALGYKFTLPGGGP